MNNLSYLRKSMPFTWKIMKIAAVWRHAILVYSLYGCTLKADEEMYKHIKIDNKVYD